MYYSERFLLYVILLVTLWGAPSEAALCKNLFTDKRTITPLAQANVIRVTQGPLDFIYKLFRPGEAHLATAEAKSLRMFQDILRKSGLSLHLKTVDSVRVTSRNEYGVMDYGPSAWLRSSLPRKALVTPFVHGQEVMKILDDPQISIATKQLLLDQALEDIQKLVQWLSLNPNYRYKGKPVKVELHGIGDVYEFPSLDGIFVYEYQSHMVVLLDSENSFVGIGLDGISNMILTENGDLILFDPT